MHRKPMQKDVNRLLPAVSGRFFYILQSLHYNYNLFTAYFSMKIRCFYKNNASIEYVGFFTFSVSKPSEITAVKHL